MSDRERWVVYPILFLTLGISLRDKIFQRVDTDNMVARRVFSEQSSSNRFWADEIYCRKLNIAQQAEIGGMSWPPGSQRNRHAGGLVIKDEKSKPKVVARADQLLAGRVSTLNGEAQEIVSIGASDNAGLLEIHDRRHGHTLDIGHLSVTGLFVRAGEQLLDWRLLYDPDADSTPPAENDAEGAPADR